MMRTARPACARPAPWTRSALRGLAPLLVAASAFATTGVASGVGSPSTAVAQVRCDFRTAQFSILGWKTDFKKCSVPLDSFRPSGSGRDGSTPLSRPRFIPAEDGNAWLRENEPVVFLEIGGDSRAYPLQILLWHEVVNDTVGGIPIVVTFSPFTNTVAVFERQIPGRTFEFGTTGTLRHSDLVMWDRQTESWWQQITGDAVVGTLTGVRLLPVAASTISWSEFRLARPYGQVLSRDTGQRRSYGRNPYVGSDDASETPIHFDNPVDTRLRAMERVVLVRILGETVAYTFSALRSRNVLMDSVGGLPIAIFFQPETISVLDRADVATSRAVGSTGVFSPDLNGQMLTFTWDGTTFVDADTGSRWTILGDAISGPLAGAQLRPIVHTDSFWAPTAAFFPEVRVWTEQ